MEAGQDTNKTFENPGISIPGVDTEAGIKLCGGPEMYMDFLRDFYGIIDKKSDEAEKFLSDGDLKGFTTLVHALKTTCRMLGDTELPERFYELEMKGKAGSFAEAEKLTPEALSRFKSLKPLLKPYIANEPADRIPFSAEEISDLLSEIEAATADFDIGSAEEAAKKLLAYECDKELSAQIIRLSELVGNLDYDEAAELARDIRDNLT